MFRHLLSTLLALGLGSTAFAAEPALRFDIVRKGEVIGSYQSSLTSREDGGQELRTVIKAEVGLGPLRLYHFDQSMTEVWRQGRLQALSSQADDDGDQHQVNVRREGEGLVLTVDGKSRLLAADSVPATLWNRQMLEGNRPIFDPVDGEEFKTQTVCHGSDCQVTGGLQRDLRYGADGLLTGLEFIGDDGTPVSYRPKK